MDKRTYLPPILAGIPDQMEICYRESIESYQFLCKITSLEDVSIPEHIGNLKKAIIAIKIELSNLHLVRKSNMFQEDDTNLQIVSRMGKDQNGKDIYILEHSPTYIVPEDRNGNRPLFLRDQEYLTRLRDSFILMVQYFDKGEQ